MVKYALNSSYKKWLLYIVIRCWYAFKKQILCWYGPDGLPKIRIKISLLLSHYHRNQWCKTLQNVDLSRTKYDYILRFEKIRTSRRKQASNKFSPIPYGTFANIQELLWSEHIKYVALQYIYEHFINFSVFMREVLWYLSLMF